jgi:hypothetical protein
LRFYIFACDRSGRVAGRRVMPKLSPVPVHAERRRGIVTPRIQQTMEE